MSNQTKTTEDRIPPHSIEAEEGVLASILIDEGKGVLAECLNLGFVPDTFYRTDHKLIFGVMCELFQANEPVEEVILFERLRTKGLADEVGGIDRIYAIQERVETTVSARFFANIVLQKWKERRLLRHARELIEAVYEPAENYDAVRAKIQAPLTAMSTLSVNEVATDVVEELDRLIVRKRKEFAGESEEVPKEWRVSMWMPKNEEQLGYIDRRETDNFIVIAAPSSRGKSTGMRQMVRANLLAHKDWNIAVFVLEGGGPKYLHHMACGHALVPNRRHHDWLTGEIAKGSTAGAKANERAEKYFEHLAFLKDQLNKRFFVFEKDRLIDDIVSRCRELEARLGRLDLVFVDYIQQVQSSKQNANREQQVSEVSNKLQGLQVSLGCPLITGSQLNSEGEARESKAIFNDATRFLRISRPKEDLNGTSQLELGRKQYWQTLEQQKNRNGETAVVGYNFNCECGAFLDYGSIPAEKRGRPKKETGNDAGEF